MKKIKYTSLTTYFTHENSTERGLTVPRERIRNYLVKGGKKKGFSLYLRDIFERLNITHNTYYKSSEINIDGKVYALFQNQSKNQKHNWFYFGTEFKARNFTTYLRKVKSFLVEKVGKEIKEAFDNIVNQIKDKYADLMADYNDIIEEETDCISNRKTKVNRDKKNGALTFLFPNVRVDIKPNLHDITYSFVHVAYRKNKELAQEFIQDTLKVFEHFFTERKELTVIVRQRPFL